MTSQSARHPPWHELYPNQTIRGLPTAEEAVKLLKARQESRLRRHLAIRRPQDLSDAEHRAAVAQAWEGEHGPRPPPWNDAGAEDADPSEVVETLLIHLDFVDGDTVAREWWWERVRWLKRCHPRVARTVRRALDRRRGK